MPQSEYDFQIPNEKLDSFHDRMDQWVSQQGFLFQVRHGASSKKIRGSRWIVTLMLRFLIVSIIAIAGLAFWLYKRTSSPKFWNDRQRSIAAIIGAEEATLSGIKFDKGRVEIRNLSFEGKESTFFHEMTGRTMSFNMGYLAGLSGDWDAGSIQIDQLQTKIRFPDERGELQKSLFPEIRGFQFSFIEINSLDLSWETFPGDQGGITDSNVQIREIGEDNWALRFTGGTLSQSWWKDLNIQSIDANLSKEGLSITNAILTAGEGRVEFTLETDSSGELRGKARFLSIPLDYLSHAEVPQILDGNISGEGTFSIDFSKGTGLITDFKAGLVDRDYITLSDNVPILRALSVVDFKRSYKSVRFTEGEFHLKSSPRQVELTNIQLKYADFLTLNGSISSKIKYKEDIKNEMILESMDSTKKSIQTSSVPNDETLLSDLALSLEDLMDENPESNELGVDDEARLQRIEASKYIRKVIAPQVSSKLIFRLQSDIFDNTEGLKDRYPAKDNVVTLELPFEGKLSNFTEKLAENILVDGVRKF